MNGPLYASFIWNKDCLACRSVLPELRLSLNVPGHGMCVMQARLVQEPSVKKECLNKMGSTKAMHPLSERVSCAGNAEGL